MAGWSAHFGTLTFPLSLTNRFIEKQIHRKRVMSLTEEEINYLESFLTSAATADDCMDIVTLEGFLTALAIGPDSVDLEDFLPMVFGKESLPLFESADEETRIYTLIKKYYDNIVYQFATQPEAFLPTLYEIEIEGQHTFSLEEWCSGFMLAVLSKTESWQQLFTGSYYKLMIPFMLFGTENDLDEFFQQTEDDHFMFFEKWTNTLVPSLTAIHAFWNSELPDDAEGYEDNPDDELLDLVMPFQMNIDIITQEDGEEDEGFEMCACGSGFMFKFCCGKKNRLH